MSMANTSDYAVMESHEHSRDAMSADWCHETIIQKFHEDLKDEIHDCTTYLDMARDLEEDGVHDEGRMRMVRGLYLMAYDEYTHAKFIHGCLVDEGVRTDAQTDADYHDMKRRIKRIFYARNDTD